jgi:hypothetical protein
MTVTEEEELLRSLKEIGDQLDRWPHLSLRDYFAGQALIGISLSSTGGENLAVMIATAAYAIADAMLAERQKP